MNRPATIIFIVIVIGCSKRSDPTPTDPLSSQIIGTWSVVIDTTKGGCYPGRLPIRWTRTFRNAKLTDGFLQCSTTLSVGALDSLEYKIVGDSLYWRYRDNSIQTYPGTFSIKYDTLKFSWGVKGGCLFQETLIRQ